MKVAKKHVAIAGAAMVAAASVFGLSRGGSDLQNEPVDMIDCVTETIKKTGPKGQRVTGQSVGKHGYVVSVKTGEGWNVDVAVAEFSKMASGNTIMVDEPVGLLGASRVETFRQNADGEWSPLHNGSGDAYTELGKAVKGAVDACVKERATLNLGASRLTSF